MGTIVPLSAVTRGQYYYMARITVLMGIYNCAPTLPAALNSLLAQTYQDFKIVLCDDGSTDDTYRVAKEYADKYENIILIKNERNMGLNYTLNHCLEKAETEYIARMDGDDLSAPMRFEKEIQFLDAHPEVAVVSTSMHYFDENGVFRTGSSHGEITKKDFVYGSPICHAPCMARTAVFKEVGGYSVSDRLLRVEDIHLWFKIFAAGYKLYAIDEPLYSMRDDQNATRRRTWKGYLNASYVTRIGFRMIGLPWYYQIYAIKPLLVGMLPKWLYSYLRKKKYAR